MKKLIAAGFAIAAALSVSSAQGEILQAPEGGKPIPLGKDRVVCFSGGFPEYQPHGFFSQSDCLVFLVLFPSLPIPDMPTAQGFAVAECFPEP